MAEFILFVIIVLTIVGGCIANENYDGNNDKDIWKK